MSLTEFVKTSTNQGYKRIYTSDLIIGDGNSQIHRQNIQFSLLERTEDKPDRAILWIQHSELDHVLSIWFTNPLKLRQIAREANKLADLMDRRKIENLWR